MSTTARTRNVLRHGALLALLCGALVQTSTAHADNLNPILGGGLGAMAGALIGQSVGGRDGAMIGAAVGGVAGVGIASQGERRRIEPARTVVYEAPRPLPAPGYQVVERVNYYPAPVYVRPGWGPERRYEEERRWEHHHGHHRGWERHGGPDYRD